GIFFLVVYFVLKSSAWTRILASLGHKVKFSDSYFDISMSETKRYIPGNIFAVTARIESFEKYGISKKMLFAAQIIEVLILLISSSVVALPGVFFLGGDISS